MNTYAIGDIHGGLKALDQLIEKANLKENDKLIFLGDYVDGWSESAQVIRYLMNLKEKYSCVFIKGNHDLWCEKWLENGSTNEVWLANGGEATINSYYEMASDERAEHLEFFKSMELYHIDDNNRLYVHAGFTSMHGPEKEYNEKTLMHDRTLWEMAMAFDTGISDYSVYYPKRFKLFKEIIIGHTPTTNYNNIDFPIKKANVWNIDTGAAFKGKITCLNLERKSYVQSDCVFEFYPEELGRNKA